MSSGAVGWLVGCVVGVPAAVVLGVVEGLYVHCE